MLKQVEQVVENMTKEVVADVKKEVIERVQTEVKEGVNLAADKVKAEVVKETGKLTAIWKTHKVCFIIGVIVCAVMLMMIQLF